MLRELHRQRKDLWDLFRVGDLCYMPTASDNSGRYHEMWKVNMVQSQEPEFFYEECGWTWQDDLRAQKIANKFTIRHAYYIDHNGFEFGAAKHKFYIQSYKGQRPIDSLQVYPTRFAENFQQLLASSKSQGAHFLKYLGPKQRDQAYNAWILTRNPPLDTREDDPEDEILQDEKEFLASPRIHRKRCDY